MIILHSSPSPRLAILIVLVVVGFVHIRGGRSQSRSSLSNRGNSWWPCSHIVGVSTIDGSLLLTHPVGLQYQAHGWLQRPGSEPPDLWC